MDKIGLNAIKKYINKTYTAEQQKKLKQACEVNLRHSCQACPAQDDCKAINRLYINPIYNGKKIGYFYLQDI